METQVNPLLEDKTEISADLVLVSAPGEEKSEKESDKVAYKAGDYICVTLNGNKDTENGQNATEPEELDVSCQPMIITGMTVCYRFIN